MKVGRRHPGESQTSFSPIPTNLQDVGRVMKICKIKDCNTQYHAKGYCNKHYMRFWKYSDPLYTKTEIHGMSHIPEYIIWNSMLARCIRKNNTSYHRYGGRGIAVCDLWLKSFKSFYEDMGPKPFPKAQIDRRDNDLGYSLDNCHWVTRIENIRKAPCTKLTIEKAKEIKELYKKGDFLQKELAKKYGVSCSTICSIVNSKIWKI